MCMCTTILTEEEVMNLKEETGDLKQGEGGVEMGDEAGQRVGSHCVEYGD